MSLDAGQLMLLLMVGLGLSAKECQAIWVAMPSAMRQSQTEKYLRRRYLSPWLNAFQPSAPNIAKEALCFVIIECYEWPCAHYNIMYQSGGLHYSVDRNPMATIGKHINFGTGPDAHLRFLHALRLDLTWHSLMNAILGEGLAQAVGWERGSQWKYYPGGRETEVSIQFDEERRVVRCLLGDQVDDFEQRQQLYHNGKPIERSQCIEFTKQFVDKSQRH
jgi:hypothetical protein